MKPIDLLLLVLPLFLLTHLWMLPLLKNRWKAGDLVQKISRSGAMIFVEKIRDLSAIAAISILFLLGFIWINDILSNGNLIFASGVVKSIDTLQSAINEINQEYGNFLVWFGLIGSGLCLYLVGNRTQQALSGAWVKRAIEIRNSFTKDFYSLEALSKDPIFREGVNRVKEIIGIIAFAEDQSTGIKLTPEKKQELEQELEQLLLVMAMEKAKSEVNIDDVINKHWQDDKQKDLEVSPINRVLRILASNRFLKDLGIVSRSLSYVAIGFLIISLTGWAADPLANSLRLTINNLRINALSEDVSRQLDQAVSFVGTVGPAPSEEQEQKQEQEQVQELEPEPEEIVGYEEGENEGYVASMEGSGQIARLSRVLAKEAVNQILNSQSFETKPRSPESKSEFIRAAILDRSIGMDAQTSSAQRVRYEVASSIKIASQLQAELAEIVESFEREIEPELERVQNRNPKYFSKIIKIIESRYSTTANAIDAQSNLISRVVGQSLSSVEVDSHNEIVKQSQKILKDVGGSAIKTWANIYVKAVVADALFDSSRASVVDKLNQEFAFKASQRTQELLENLAIAENSGWSLSSAEIQERKATERLAHNISSRYRNDAVKAAVRQNLGGYSELFPDAISVSGNIAGELTSSYSRFGNRPSSNLRPKNSARSRNFRLASRSFRARGVLFGQDLTGSNLSVSDVKWAFSMRSAGSPTQVSISLKLDGQWYELGNFYAAVVNQGIRYAADQRVVAATITRGDEEVIRRVTYLHPALEDTPLGCRVVEVDRLVDQFTVPSEDAVEPKLEPIYEDRMALSRFLKFSSLVEKIGYKNLYGQCPRTKLGEILDNLEFSSISFSPSLINIFENFLRNEVRYPEYGKRLIDVSLECSTVQKSDTASCLCGNLSGGLSSEYWFPEDHTSQFREAPAELSSDLQWLGQSEDRFKYIDFWIHTTFALRKLNYDGDGVSDESTATPMEFDKEQLTIMKEVIVSKLVSPYLIDELHSTSVEEFMAPLEQFLIIQRLSRAAFNGQLGERFPLEKLLDLSRETKEFVPDQPTMRWEPYVDKEYLLRQVLAGTDEYSLRRYNDFQMDRDKRIENGTPLCGVVSL